MGFHFMKKNEDGENYKVRDLLKNRKSVADLFPNDENEIAQKFKQPHFSNLVLIIWGYDLGKLFDH